MSDHSWVLRGIDPEARQQAEDEATRLGLSLADYLTDLVVRRAVLDQLSGASEADQTRSDAGGAAIFARPPESSEGFAMRQRLKALERRLSTTVGSLDGAVHALDTSLFDITARVGDVEGLAGDTAHALGLTQHEVSNGIAGLKIHLTVLEDNFSGHAEAQDQRAAGLDRRIDGVEYVARGAERSAAILADAHEALKHAVADDFAAFTHETADRLNDSLAEVRAAADVAAEHADAAVAHLISELRGLRASNEHRLEESAEETRARMHAAFADAADRMGALAERVTDNERYITRTADHLRAQLTDVEDGAQIALEETAHALREADAALAANLGRASQEQHAALEAVQSDLAANLGRASQEHYAALEATRSDLAFQLGALREDQVTQSARLKLVDVALGNTINGIGEVREAVERRVTDVEGSINATLIELSQDLDQRFDTIAARVGRGEQQTQALQQRLGAELDRIEASTFAALEKQRRDIGAGDAEAARRLDAAMEECRAELTEVRNRAVNEAHLLREDHTGALARLTLLDNALTRLEGATITTNGRIDELESAVGAADPALEQRLAQLEYAAANAETEQALAIVRDDVAALSSRLSALSADNWAADRIAELQRRLDTRETSAGELSEGLQGLARMLNRVAAQSVETSQRAEDRAHQLEVALADFRLETLSNVEANNAAAAIQVLQERVTAGELRQAHALDALRITVETDDSPRAVQTLQERMTAVELQHANALNALRNRVEANDSARVVQTLAERMTAFELRHANALDTLRADIARFVGDNDRRLDALETKPAPPVHADLAPDFESLRARIEERVLGVELRSVRTLEQVVDTMALLEQRLLGAAAQDQAVKSA